MRLSAKFRLPPKREPAAPHVTRKAFPKGPARVGLTDSQRLLGLPRLPVGPGRQDSENRYRRRQERTEAAWTA